jgi:acetyl-CoA acetyltransferase family protein
MRDACIPYGAYWSTPFVRWQGSFAHLHPIEFGAWVARAELARRRIDPAALDYGVLGVTVPSSSSFYGLPWLTGLVGAPHVGGPTVNQACATSARILEMAAHEVASGGSSVALAISTDKCSNGPHIYYPAPGGPGGTGTHEDWVLDNFSNDPLGRHAMIDTAENVARKHGITRAENDAVALRRYEQYADACANEHAFHKRYMTLPFAVPDARLKKTVATLAGDEGIHDTTAAGLAALKPVKPDGTVTFGAQTHPADGSAAMIVTTRERARELATDAGIEVRLRGFGLARAALAHMPEAPIPAAKRALAQAGLEMKQIDAVKTHNPFAVNDVCFARETGFAWEKMNNYGCSLVWGHPQGPTGLRAIIELVEELALRGGGLGLFTGCAAGDTGMAVVVEVRDARK